MKQLIILVFITLLGGQLFAQNNIQYTQFFFNKMAYNPAYAGSRDALTLGAQYRNQWSGITGAPRTGTVYAHFPFLSNRNGAGIGITNDQIGKVSITKTDLSYAYRIPMGNSGNLGIGISAQFEYGQIDWTKAEVLDVDDEHVPAGAESYMKPNFGAGLFYSDKKFFVGLSVPQLLRNTLFINGEEKVSQLSSYYLMGGVMLPISASVWFKPTAMLSYNPHAPFEADINASFLFMEKLWLGATYRLGDSVDGIIQYIFSPRLKAGIAYDFTTSELNNYTSGSWEILVEYSFILENEGMQHLRFF